MQMVDMQALKEQNTDTNCGYMYSPQPNLDHNIEVNIQRMSVRGTGFIWLSQLHFV